MLFQKGSLALTNFMTKLFQYILLILITCMEAFEAAAAVSDSFNDFPSAGLITVPLEGLELCGCDPDAADVVVVTVDDDDASPELTHSPLESWYHPS